ncbi:MAG: polyprenyl synthetase family protein [Betaproteobacteria bacterium]|nr:polyprenyl synthetase family protein [Betaproteobacteria bacterium]NBY72019.1 polyprenyl synthetase family protein [Betaproteobacteria bacterium]NDD11915.1 polyprenyl synthetase family protein [Betaproteobacteria bacterium]
MSQSFAPWVQTSLQQVEGALSAWVGQDAPPVLAAAMRYAVLDGGKRLRPLLVLATCEALGGNAQAALRAACAVELIHAYSLVHDDMPCMDNDVLRRGKPTVHVHMGEATALLAGDALQALAFELITQDAQQVPLYKQARLCGLLARAAGARGMAGGQAIDLASVGLQLDEAQLRHMHSLKTGALLECSVLMGATCGEVSEPVWNKLQTLGRALGLAFQVVDDILDVTADTSILGKTAGKDAAQDKPTYVALMGLERSRALADALRQEAYGALASLEDLGVHHQDHLRGLADWVVQRTH